MTSHIEAPTPATIAELIMNVCIRGMVGGGIYPIEMATRSIFHTG